ESRDIQIDAVDLRKEVRAGAFRHAAKTLLEDISLSIPPGSMVALIGASGVGKTTLLHALSGHDPVHSGNVLYNGEDLYAHLAAYSASLGYVPQDDIIHKNLSVERALFYAARLRLPRDMSHRQIKERVAETLQDIDLVGRRKQRIAQLSGGERKRVNIGVELLARPAVFFLDEPTSGLDAGLDRKIMDLLRRLADRGHSVVLTTHTTSHLGVCDFVCFLAPGGRLAYYGPPDELRRHFQLDDYAEIYTTLAAAPERWVAAFRQSPDYMKYVVRPRLQAKNRGQATAIALHEERAAQAQTAATRGATSATVDRSSPASPASPATEPISGPYSTPDASWQMRAARQRTHLSSAWRQFRLLTLRYIELMAHDPANLLILLAQAPIIAILITLLSRGNDIHIVATGSVTPYPVDMYAQRTLFIMVCSAVWFGTINAAREIVKEAPVYRRERTIHLGILPYVFSKIVVLTLLSAIQDAILLAIVGHKSGYPNNGLLWPHIQGAFVEFYLSLLLLSVVGLMMGLLVSALAPNTDRAISFVPILLIPQIIFANVIFTLKGAGEYVSYIIPARWGMQAMGSIDRLRDQFTDHGDSPFFRADRLHLIGFWLALVALAIIFFALTAYFQRRKDLAH
ncbi:MAG: ATP-binding cassette domain-containing protein, partial [Ktedonobacterales bacterium]